MVYFLKTICRIKIKSGKNDVHTFVQNLETQKHKNEKKSCKKPNKNENKWNLYIYNFKKQICTISHQIKGSF